MIARKIPSLPTAPFVPGPGGTPPVLAGRESEKSELQGLLQRLVAKRLAATNAILTGPRGNGKTALLSWMEEKAGKQRLDSLRITPSVAPSLEGLARLIKTRAGAMVKEDKELEKLRLDASSPEGIGGGVEIQWKERQSVARQQIGGLLARRAERRPFVLLIDEAHRLDPDVGETLLNEAQIVASKSPFLLVLAGTPDLKDALSAMHATFWDRSLKMGIGLLPPEAARRAIEEPLSAHRIELEEEALWDEVVADSQAYPYFVQFWGQQLWKRAETHLPARGAIILSRADVEAAGAEVHSEKTGYYNNRYEEFIQGALVPAAQVVARAYGDGKGSFFKEELLSSLAPAVGADADNALTKLAHAGFVWCDPGRDRWTAGIPSLMNYVTARAGKAPEAGTSITAIRAGG